MNKLEIKHLAPYLPYGLKGIANEKDIMMLLAVSLKYDQNPMWITLWDMKEEEGEIRDVFQEGFEPLLRPLSDLIKVIEHDGEMFVPMKQIFCDEWEKWDGEEDTACISMLHTYKASKGKVFPEFLQGWVLDNLFKWHFDVFDLIEMNLAIDINTIEK